jgi:hypothetical protein
MPIHDADRGTEVVPGPGSRPVSNQGRAYCGPAHGQQWPVIGREPPAWVELPCGVSSAIYRLVRQPRTGRPAQDQLGNFFYVPMNGDHTEPRVITLPQGDAADGPRAPRLTERSSRTPGQPRDRLPGHHGMTSLEPANEAGVRPRGPADAQLSGPADVPDDP